MGFDLSTRRTWVVHDFRPDFPGRQIAAVWTRYEGSPSADGRYWALAAQNDDWQSVAIAVFDLQENRVIATRQLEDDRLRDALDNLHISPLGSYVIADFSDAYCERDRLGTVDRPCGVMLYDRTLTTGRGLLRMAGHGDLGIDAAGREVMVFQDTDNDQIAMVDLATGAVTGLFPIDFSHSALGFHVSTRALNRPGWAVVSTYNGSRPASATWMDDQILLVEMKPGGRVARLAHTRSIYNEDEEQDYWAEPHASTNADLTRIVFTSNWGRSGTAEVEMFMIVLPESWPSMLP
jgi:hypothetical protein